MKSSLSGSTYILLTAKSSIDTYTLPKLSNTVFEVPVYNMSMLNYQGLQFPLRFSYLRKN